MLFQTILIGAQRINKISFEDEQSFEIDTFDEESFVYVLKRLKVGGQEA